jgi:DNA replication protein DnaC
VFDDTDEGRIRELAGGDLSKPKSNFMLIGGAGTNKTHLAIAIARNCTRGGSRGRFFNLVDLVNQLEQEKAAGKERTRRRGS